ncbi:pirin family protein [Emcibacter sp. SYSU 3D8]|uniref:pirin family protein n=1 Tax=Emcibacter sp. SYSU 3D8 TaxID=3133969 RepID=UPI0031FF124A
MPSPVELVIEPRPRDLGGFEVRRVLPFVTRRMVGPFVFLDHIGPAVFAPGTGVDVRPHPHIGLATVTYLFEGEMMHRDSVGAVQNIMPGDVNWMTAGRGIVHSERTAPEARARGFAMHGIQAWVALPVEDEETEPSFHHHGKDSLPMIEHDGVSLRLIAGSAYGKTSPVKTYSPTFYLDAVMAAGSTLPLTGEHKERAAYIAEGTIDVAGEAYESGRMLVFAPDTEVTLRAQSDARLMLLGGANIGKRHIWWNLVSSRPERIEQAKAAWKEQRFPPVPGETEFTPLPE